ncbi:TrkA C-terminal domain-containing protein, partial [Methanospirillum sp.]|uniref:TrkA C-terminal domain-containing protein n=3 Tax=Methanospirillum sp. TaxID=45200 RepID=UPI002B6B70C0
EEQIRMAAESAAGQMKEGAQEISTKISETAGKIQKSAAETAEQITTKAKELTEKVKEDTKPIGKKVSRAARSSADAIRDKIPIGKLSPEIEKGLSVLSQEEAKKIRTALTGKEGVSAAVLVKFAAGRSIGNLTIPPEVTLVTVQRKDQILGLDADIILKENDIVYLSGPSDAVGFVTRMLEG